MHLGLIGGIGPAATVAYYERLVAAFAALDEPLELTITHADLSVLAANASAGRAKAQAGVFAGHVDGLRRAGCKLAALTSVTAHFCFDELAARASLPLSDTTADIAAACAARGIRRLGLLGSGSVMASALYGRLQGVETLAPDRDMQGLGNAYMAMATSGACSAETADRFVEAGRRLVVEQGADAVLLAGTDLDLAFGGRSVDYPVIDALDIHVAALVGRATA